jgi:hypothetical protein
MTQPAAEAEPDLSKLFVETPDPAPLASESALPEGTAAPEAASDLLKDATEPEPGKADTIKDPAQERAAKRIAAATRIELRASQQRSEIAREREAIAKERAALDAEKRARVDLREKARTAPTEALKELGFDAPEDFLRRVIAEGTPEAAAQAKGELERREFVETREELKALKAELEKERADLRATQQTQSLRQAQSAFVELVAKNADKYPTLVDEFPGEEIARMALELVRSPAPNDPKGRTLGQLYFDETEEHIDDDTIAEHLESLAKARAAAKNAWRQRVRGANPGQGVSESAQSGPQVSRPNAPRTMTNGQAAPKVSPPRAPTQDEIDAECIRLLEAGIRSD